MSNFAPANSEGQKPYVITIHGWGGINKRIRYADTPSNARSGYPLGQGERIAGVRRATADDMKGARR